MDFGSREVFASSIEVLTHPRAKKLKYQGSLRLFLARKLGPLDLEGNSNVHSVFLYWKQIFTPEWYGFLQRDSFFCQASSCTVTFFIALTGGVGPYN